MNINEFKRHSKARFYQDSFVDSIDFDFLEIQVIDKNLNKSDLRERTGLSTTTIAKLGRDEYVSMEVVSKICATLQCDVGDIMEYVSDEN